MLAYNGHAVIESHHNIMTIMKPNNTRLQGESPKVTFGKQTILVEISTLTYTHCHI